MAFHSHCYAESSLKMARAEVREEAGGDSRCRMGVAWTCGKEVLRNGQFAECILKVEPRGFAIALDVG